MFVIGSISKHDRDQDLECKTRIWIGTRIEINIGTRTETEKKEQIGDGITAEGVIGRYKRSKKPFDVQVGGVADKY
ncbi:hypothetical protein EVAR_30652_1 [Eumeta japonica]|uniref:Uncharacterized protein n=1 Tax=Eumeta variegata TaxID=151549 RepID=A0A4C1VTQ7_EUMVA|nr:hypothetical protein EVAR_30652_1 [Eumeta japonica]